MELVDLERFFGVPVTVQLRSPYAVVDVSGMTVVSHAEDPKVTQAILAPVEQMSAEGTRLPTLCQILVGAVLSPVDNPEFVAVKTQTSDSGAGPTIVEILLSTHDIYAITRVAAYTPPPPVAEPSRILL